MRQLDAGGAKIGMVLEQTRIFFKMIKFEHTLFALPFALMAAFMAARGRPSWQNLTWIIFAMVGARNAAMAFNRLVDARFDELNKRTKDRALPRGLIKRSRVWGFILIFSALFFLSAYMLNPLCFRLSPFFLLFLLAYSYTKRFTWTSHIWLGISLGLAPLGAWIAILGEFSLIPLILGLGVSFWVAGFDIIYACLDYDFDKKAGLYSIPRAFGIRWALFISILFHVITAFSFFIVGKMAGLGPLYFAGYTLTVLCLAYEHLILKPDDLSRVNLSFFTMNGIVSILLSIAAISAVLIGT